MIFWPISLATMTRVFQQPVAFILFVKHGSAPNKLATILGDILSSYANEIK